MLLLDPTVKLQMAPEVQLRLALFPAVTVHVVPAPLHGPLQEFPQLPPQSPVVQDKEQLPADGSQPICVNALLPPQPRSIARTIAASVVFKGPPLSTGLQKSDSANTAGATAAARARNHPVSTEQNQPVGQRRAMWGTRAAGRRCAGRCHSSRGCRGREQRLQRMLSLAHSLRSGRWACTAVASHRLDRRRERCARGGARTDAGDPSPLIAKE